MLRAACAVVAASCLLSAGARAGLAPNVQSRASVRVVGPRAKVDAVVQDSRSYIWTAGDQGVCRFDGLSWACPVAQKTLAIAADREGGLWILSEQKLGRIGPGIERPRYLAGRTPATSLAVDGHNRVWLGTNEGLFTLDAALQAVERKPVLAESVSALSADARGIVVVATGTRLIRLINGVPRELWRAPFSIRAITCAPNGDVIAALHDGTVWRLAANTAAQDFAFKLPVPEYPTLGPLIIDRENRLWLGDRESLLYLGVNDRAVTPLDFSLTVSTFRLNALTIDHEGSLWAGSDTGLVQIRFAQPLYPLSVQRSVTRADIVFSVAQAANGDIWAATLNGLARFDGHGFSDYDNKSGLIYPDLRSVAVSPDGTVWAAGLDTGVFRRVADRFVPVLDEDGLRVVGASAVRPRKQGGVWVGLWHGGFGMVNNRHFTWIMRPAVLDRDRVVDMHEASDGTLWLASERDGVLAWRDGTLTRYGVESGIPRVELLSMHPASDEGLWIGTDGAGLLRFDRKKARQLTTQHGLDDNRVFSIVQDHQDNLWIGSPRGLSVVKVSELEVVASGKKKLFQSVMYGAEDGVVGEPTHRFPPSSTRGNNGALIFATAQGIVLASAEGNRVTSSPQIFIDSVTLDGHRVDSMRGVEGTSGATSDLKIDFSAPTFLAPHRLRFRYQLQGLSSRWFETTSGPLLLDHLPRGRYRLLLEAYHPGTDNGPHRQAALQIHLVPPWHNRTDVRAGSLALALLLLAYVAWARRQRTAQSQAAIVAERARIAHEIHDGLEQDLTGLRLQIDVVKQSLAVSPQKAVASLQRAGELINDASVDLRMAIWRLQLDATSTAELVRTLDQRLARAAGGTQISVVTTAVGPSRTLPVGTATHVVSIVREAVANALKHALPTRVSVVFDTTDEKQLILTIADDGKSQANASDTGAPGMGIAGMKARARAVNGALEILAGDGGGTCIRLRAPLRG